MAKRVPLGAIGVTRKVGNKNVTVYPTVGKPFDFTDDEIKSLNAMQKKSGMELIRKPVNEDVAPQTQAPQTQANQGNKPEATEIADLTVPQLREMAAARHIDLGDVTKKDDIIARIKAAEEEDL